MITPYKQMIYTLFLTTLISLKGFSMEAELAVVTEPRKYTTMWGAQVGFFQQDIEERKDLSHFIAVLEKERFSTYSFMFLQLQRFYEKLGAPKSLLDYYKKEDKHRLKIKNPSPSARSTEKDKIRRELGPLEGIIYPKDFWLSTFIPLLKTTFDQQKTMLPQNGILDNNYQINFKTLAVCGELLFFTFQDLCEKHEYRQANDFVQDVKIWNTFMLTTSEPFDQSWSTIMRDKIQDNEKKIQKSLEPKPRKKADTTYVPVDSAAPKFTDEELIKFIGLIETKPKQTKKTKQKPTQLPSPPLPTAAVLDHEVDLHHDVVLEKAEEKLESNEDKLISEEEKLKIELLEQIALTNQLQTRLKAAEQKAKKLEKENTKLKETIEEMTAGKEQRVAKAQQKYQQFILMKEELEKKEQQLQKLKSEQASKATSEKYSKQELAESMVASEIIQEAENERLRELEAELDKLRQEYNSMMQSYTFLAHQSSMGVQFLAPMPLQLPYPTTFQDPVFAEDGRHIGFYRNGTFYPL